MTAEFIIMIDDAFGLCGVGQPVADLLDGFGRYCPINLGKLESKGTNIRFVDIVTVDQRRFAEIDCFN